ncbi:sigma-70 family RNA polymerase sigma factor [Glycomyces sp. A-F 0318]|uniref:sigma-70 family RNA polymerase sigma factor n=1 Tax=Glycomyces amatae TaxID=2881355 RepID=UPI001E51B394|nr:sigma-70 family RNA polymerase sigma factor [Glycomyces amatae]MCD0442400.1 sigma-70 family RNA polymerase sigma factor [Glycomyces amatae]
MYRTSLTAASRPDFDGFYAANVNPITAQIRAYVGDLAEAEDLVAEAFCRALGRWRTISAYDNPAVWVRRVAWNLATSRLRRRAVLRRLLLRQRPAHVEGPRPDRIDLEQALAELKERHRKAVVLYYLADMTTAEIAEQEGVAETTVRSWLTRGRAALAERLRIDEPEERQ